MEHKVSINCPYCRKPTSIRQATTHYGDARITLPLIADGIPGGWWMGICNNCSGPVLINENCSEIYPHPLPSPTDIRIPEEIRKDLNEGKLCLSVNCYRACCVLSRRGIQQACLFKGAKKEKLEDQIKELAESRIITQELAEWATLVRWIGNDAAHPKAPPVGREEAEDCLELAEQFLHVLFVTPSIAEERKKKREEAKKQ